MSGIVGLVHVPRVPVPAALLRDLTDALAFRGPDAQTVWTDGCAGLGCALLRTTREAAGERQPLTLDGICHLVADVRLDGREELIRLLAAAGQPAPPHASDAELVLRAFAVWGDDCVRHLRGDFAFAVWDTRQRRLFAARDHFGVKPFYYVHLEHGFLFGNTLACLRRHPDVSAQLDERSVGDFLLFGFNTDQASTTFTDISRLPPAHTLTWRDGDVTVCRYWSLPLAGRIRYRRSEEYVEHFRTLFQSAIADRLRTDRAAILLSGGIDSTALAAVARNLHLPMTCDLQAHTISYDSLFADQEGKFAGLAAEALEIPIQFFPAGEYIPFGQGGRGCETPEPNDEPIPAISTNVFQRIASEARVVLCGDGGDPLLYSSPAYMMMLLWSGRWATWLWECTRHAITRHRLPPLGLRSWLRRRLGWTSSLPQLPMWLDAAFARRTDLPERWRAFHAHKPLPTTLHAEACNVLDSPLWSTTFERQDPGFTACPLEVRSPFFDVRLVEFVLSIPVLPWCADKELVRNMVRGLLPEAVRTRPKAPLAGDPVRCHVRAGRLRWADHFDPMPELAAYVDTARMRRLLDEVASPDSCWKTLVYRPIALNYWLRRQASFPERDIQEPSDERQQAQRDACQVALS